jgi:hypothetical protein
MHTLIDLEEEAKNYISVVQDFKYEVPVQGGKFLGSTISSKLKRSKIEQLINAHINKA